jgi:hypothetical protein
MVPVVVVVMVVVNALWRAICCRLIRPRKRLPCDERVLDGLPRRPARFRVQI